MYINLSPTCFLVTLPSANKAVYEVQPQHINDIPGSTLNERAIMHGRQIAHELDGRWYRPDGWTEVTDLKLIALFERCPEATERKETIEC